MILSTLLLTGLIQSPYISQEIQEPEPGGRTPVVVRGDMLSPELRQALLSILEVEATIEELTRPEGEGGAPLTEEQFQEKLFGEGSALLAFLEPRVSRFNFDRTNTHINDCVDSIRFDAGYEACRDLLVERPDLEPRELLDLYTIEFMELDPIWGSESAQEYHEVQRKAARLAPLGNGGALGYLTWGLLYQEEYWKPKERDREAFLLALLERGFDSQLVARVVARSLSPPMIRGEKPGHGIAGSVKSKRAKVGFTQVHEELLMSDLEVAHYLEDAPDAGEDPDLDMKPGRIALDGRGGALRIPNRRGHLKTWLPRMLQQVREELYPGGASLRMRRGGSLEERMTFWKQLFANQGYVTARDMALEELRAITTGEDGHPLSQAIEKLLERQAAGILTSDEGQELLRLRGKREQDQESLIREIVKLTVGSGLSDFYDLATSTLAEDLPAALATTTAERRDAYLSMGWVVLTAKPNPGVINTLEAAFMGELDLEDFAMEQLIWDAARSQYAGGTVVLEGVLERKRPRELVAALMNSEWLEDARFVEEVDNLLDQRKVSGMSAGDKLALRAGYFSSLRNRKDPDLAKSALIQTFTDGHWGAKPGAEYWGTSLDEDLPWVLSHFADAELDAFVASGMLLPSLR